MLTSRDSIWKSLPLLTRLAFIFANNFANGSLFFIFRSLSLFQILLGILTNINSEIFKHRTFFASVYKFFGHLFNFMSLRFYSDSYFILIGILVIYFIFHVMMITKTLYLTFVENPRNAILIKFYATLTLFHTEVLYYPINLGLFRFFNLVMDNQITIYSNSKDLLMSIILILLCLNSFLTYYNIVFCYSQIKSNVLVSRKGCLHLLGIASLKLFLPLFKCPLIFIETSYELGSVIISMLISFGILFYTAVLLPEYDLKTLKMHIIFNSMITCITTGQLVEILIEDKELIFIIILFILPFWVKFNLIRLLKLIKFIKNNPCNPSNINYSAHLEGIYNELDDSLELNLNKKKFSSTFVEVSRILYSSNIESNFDEIMNRNRLASFQSISKAYMKKSLEKLINLQPKNVLSSLTYAQLILDHFSLYSKSYYLCMKASLQRLSTPERISIFYLKERIQETLVKEIDRSIASSISARMLWQQLVAENAFQEFQSSVCRYIEKSIEFWQKFRIDKPDILTLIKKAKSIEQERLLVELKWKGYQSQFFQNHTKGCLLYGLLKTQFMNMPSEGSRYIEKHNLSMENKLFSYHSNHQNHQEYGTITASGGKDTLGKILSYSGSIPSIFNREKGSILELNINLLMPQFYQEIHNRFLLDHYETGKPALLGQEKQLYGKDANNNIFPISITIGVPPHLEKGIVYIALIKKIEDENEYILFSEDGLIDEVSIGIKKTLNIQPYKKNNIFSVCPGFNLSDFQQSHQQKNNAHSKEIVSSYEETLNNCTDQSIMLNFNQVGGHVGKPVSFQVRVSKYLYFEKVVNVMVLHSQRKAHKKFKTIKQESSPNKFKIANFHKVSTEYTQNKTTKETGFIDSLDLDKKVKDSDRKQLKVSNITLIKRNEMIDNFQKVLLKYSPNKLKSFFVILFLFILISSLTIATIQYILLQDSGRYIDFATNSIKITYERLTSLGWAWLYSLSYTTRVDQLTIALDADLDRFKLYIRTNRQKMKNANDELMKVVGTGNNYQQDQFFAKNIKFVYDNSSANLQERVLNSFEAINVLVDKMIKFDLTPHKIVLQYGSPDLDFLRNNAMNDLLISSERIVEIVEDEFSNAIVVNNNLSISIFMINLAVNLIGIFLVIVIFYNNYQRLKRIIRPLINIHLTKVDQIIYKLASFQRLLKEENISNQDFNKLYFKPINHAKALEQSKLTTRDYVSKGMLRVKLKQILLLIFLIVCFSLGPLFGYISSDKLINQLLSTNNRIIVIYKARYNCILGLASVVSMIENRNTTTMRNQRPDLQLTKNIRAVFPNEIMFKTFTDENGKFIDPSIETLFKGKPCALVIDYPASQNSINCPKATNNQSIGVFAVNSYYRDELYSIGSEMMGNLTFQKSKQMLPLSSSYLAPKSTTIIGAYMYIIDLMIQKFNQQMFTLLNDGRIELLLELLLMSIIGLFIIWILIKKVLNDPAIRLLLQLVPFEEISKNKLLKNMIQKLYDQKMEILNNI